MITHTDLCVITAKRFIDKVALYEYKSTASSEEPDVLIFGLYGTSLYEIKTSRSDFLADSKKKCRRKYKSFSWVNIEKINDPVIKRAYVRIRQGRPELFLQQAPHLGNKRYFVCEPDIIRVSDLPEGWGLYWYKNGKFYRKRESTQFRADLKKENALIVHAMRRYASGDDTGILINTYAEASA